VTTTRGARLLLALAAVAVAFAAADTYVVVLALPDMMATVGLDVDELQRAAPIVSGFLLGYVAMLPLIGRIADLRGRVPVLVGSLLVFGLGSLVTALATDLPTLVSGRFLQGLGGGGLVPATLALVADLYPAERRAVPLGVVSAVQEVGSVLGPLYGALVLAVADWQEIFWINLAVGLVLAAALGRLGRLGRSGRVAGGRLRIPDPLGLVLLAAALAGLVLGLARPEALVSDLTLGWPFVPLTGSSRGLAPLTLATVALAVLLLWRCLAASRPLVDVRAWARGAAQADLPGAGLLALALAGVILAFATADPATQVFSAAGGWLLAGSAAATVLLLLHLRRAAPPLVPRGALQRAPAWTSLVASFFVGAALIAALVDIPVFARLTSYPDSQLGAALVLVRLLLALPVGAVVGGYLTRRWGAGPVAAAGMGCAAVAFWWMSTWDSTALDHPLATVPLLLGGLGFGLALAPVNAALLGATATDVHGLASALVVVARMVGMLVGISVLTELGLRKYFAARDVLPPATQVCGDGLTTCSTYTDLLQGAVISQIGVIFLGAAACAVVAGACALWGFRETPRAAAPLLRQ
jgi:MFS family permease